MVEATRWRVHLLGTKREVEKLRLVEMTVPRIEEIAYELEEINKDLPRTYPSVLFFRKKRKELRNILLWYSYTNVCVSYCQSFSYLTYVLYHVYFHDDSHHAMVDTYYSMHKLILVVRPMLPKHKDDEGPLMYMERLENLILNELNSYDKRLFQSVKKNQVLRHLIIQGFSSFYLNWFSFQNGKRLLNFFINKDSKVIFHRMIMFMVSFFIVNREYFIHFDELTCMDFISRKHLFRFDSVFYQVNLLNYRST